MMNSETFNTKEEAWEFADSLDCSHTVDYEEVYFKKFKWVVRWDEPTFDELYPPRPYF